MSCHEQELLLWLKLSGLFAAAVSHLCQQVACMMCPQLAVWIPRDRSGCMNSGSWLSANTVKQLSIKNYSHWLISVMIRLHLPGLGKLRRRFLDKTVDLWTKAARTMAFRWPLTSCSSWHNMQVTSWRLSAPLTLLGPTHTSERQDCSRLGGLGGEGRKYRWRKAANFHMCELCQRSLLNNSVSVTKCTVFPPNHILLLLITKIL